MTYLRAVLFGVAGSEVAEILDRFADAEFVAEWDELRAVHGADADPGMLTRSDAQRRADALAAIVRRAAAAHPDARDPEPVVNLISTQAVFDEALRAVIEARRPDFDLVEPTRVWSAGHNGVEVLPADVLAAAVGHVRRVVIDLGRRRRLFSGAAATAAELQHAVDRDDRCLWPGCGLHRTQHDHVAEWHRGHGPTEVRNEGPLCARHNWIKTRGYRTWRDNDGIWHTRPPRGHRDHRRRSC